MAVARICRGMAFFSPRERASKYTSKREQRAQGEDQSAGPNFRDGGMIFWMS